MSVDPRGSLKKRIMRYSIGHKNVSLILGRFKIKKKNIRELVIHITKKCNLSCIYCYEKKYKKGTMSMKKLTKLINEASHLGVRKVIISGGEPFLHKNLYEIIQLCSNNGQFVEICTNGTLINREWIEKLKGFGDSIEILFKMDTPITYKTHTGRDVYSIVERNMKACSRNGLKTFTFIVPTKLNLKYIPDIVQRSLELGARPKLARYIPTGSKADERLELNPSEFLSAISGFYIGISRHTREPVDKIRNEVKNISLMLNVGFCGCYSTMSISVASNGDVTYCPMADPKDCIGNINEDSLETIFKKIEEEHNHINRIPEECKECQHSMCCRGGCKTYTIIKTGSYNNRDPLCINNSMLWASRLAIDTYCKTKLLTDH